MRIYAPERFFLTDQGLQALREYADYLTLPEAASLAGVSRETLRRWASKGRVRSVVLAGWARRVRRGFKREWLP